MRIILKPGGVLIVLSALCALVVLFMLVFRKGKVAPAVPKSSTVALAPAKPTASALEQKQSVSLLENGDFSKGLAGIWNFSKGKPILVKEKGPDGSSQFLRFQFVPEGNHFWSVNMSQSITKPLKKGDKVIFRGWMRSPESVVLNYFIEEAASPYGKTAMSRLPLTPEWKEYYASGVINRDYEPGEARMTLHFGVIPGAVAMSGFRLENHGPPVSPASSSAEIPARK